MQLGLTFYMIYISKGMFMPSNPSSVRKKNCWQEKAKFAITGKEIQMKQECPPSSD